MKHLLTLFALIPGIAAPAAILQPVAISSPQGSFPSPGFGLIEAINQSGLSSAYVSGVTDFATYTASETHDSGTSTTINSGFTNSNAGYPQIITFDLGSIYQISTMALWATSNIGVANFALFADSDGDFTNGNSGQLGGAFVAAGSLVAIAPAQLFAFSSTSTRFVHLQVQSTTSPGNWFPGLGEVAFEGTAAPEPGTVGLMTGALLAFAGLKYRRR